MQKTNNKITILLAASMIFAGYAGAQQTPAGAQTPATQTPATTPTTKTPAAKTGTAKTGTATGARPAFTLKTEKDKNSYAVGMNIGGSVAKTMEKSGVDVDMSVLARGIKDALVKAKPLMTDDEVKATLTALTATMRTKQEEAHKVQEAKMQAEGVTNKSEGEAFLAANKTKEGVVTLPSGLQYIVLKEGTGPKPTAADSVLCNYKGTLLNGTEFDSSYKRGRPLTIGVGQVIKGWTEALEMMPVGSKWQLFVPSDLAYGAQPDPRSGIGPNATLIFEVELLSIQPKAPTAPPAATPAPTSAPAPAPAAKAPTAAPPPSSPATPSTPPTATAPTAPAAPTSPPPTVPPGTPKQ